MLTFAVVEKLLCEDGDIKHRPVLAFSIFLAGGKTEGEMKTVMKKNRGEESRKMMRNVIAVNNARLPVSHTDSYGQQKELRGGGKRSKCQKLCLAEGASPILHGEIAHYCS